MSMAIFRSRVSLMSTKMVGKSSGSSAPHRKGRSGRSVCGNRGLGQGPMVLVGVVLVMDENEVGGNLLQHGLDIMDHLVHVGR